MRCQLVAADPRTQHLQTMPFEVARVERASKAREAASVLEESQQRQQVGWGCWSSYPRPSLMGGGKKAIGPIDRAARGPSGIGQHHIGHSGSSVSAPSRRNPRTHNRKPIELKAGVLLEGGRYDWLSRPPWNGHRRFIGHLADVRKDPTPTSHLAMLKGLVLLAQQSNLIERLRVARYRAKQATGHELRQRVCNQRSQCDKAPIRQGGSPGEPGQDGEGQAPLPQG